jgi:hypothetical protein
MSSQKKRPARIEPFRHKVETDPKFFEKSWKKLHDAIREIYNHNASGLSFEELYRLHTIIRQRPPCFFLPPSNCSSEVSSVWEEVDRGWIEQLEISISWGVSDLAPPEFVTVSAL